MKKNITSSKILFILADVGVGHIHPTKAIIESLKCLQKNNLDIHIVDLFKLTKVQLFSNSNKSWEITAQNKYIEIFSAILFRLINTRPGNFFFRKFVISNLYPHLEKIMKKYDPDIVVSIHPITNIPVGEYKKRHKNFKFIVQVTDAKYFLRCSAEKNADLTISPTEAATKQLINYELDKKKIVGPLFPIRSRIISKRDKKTILKELGFKPDKKTVLFTGGGVGIASLHEAVEKLSKKDLQLIILAARSKRYKNKLEKWFKDNKNIKVLEFVENIEDYFQVADIVIAKPGMSSISELELLSKNTILTREVGRHEWGNILWAIENPRFKFIENDFSRIPDLVNEIFNNKKEIKFKPRRDIGESKKIAEIILKYIS